MRREARVRTSRRSKDRAQSQIVPHARSRAFADSLGVLLLSGVASLRAGRG
ncbi:hypothetical protein ACIQWZ_31550 [Streptomyces sp. NPDC098077]|uniref:hypothetical protein n=1 Tax=Streptomyces sp. NPDC098077 TaxID=3366093 RepID=UPI00382DAF81